MSIAKQNIKNLARIAPASLFAVMISYQSPTALAQSPESAAPESGIIQEETPRRLGPESGFPLPPQTGMPPQRTQVDESLPDVNAPIFDPALDQMLPVTNDDGAFLIDDIPTDLTVGTVERPRNTGPVDNLPKRIEFRTVRDKANADPKVAAAFATLIEARTNGGFQQVRNASREYYGSLYQKMRRLSPKLADLIHEAEIRDMKRSADHPAEFQLEPIPETILPLLEES